jgi:hypothetical protein
MAEGDLFAATLAQRIPEADVDAGPKLNTVWNSGDFTRSMAVARILVDEHDWTIDELEPAASRSCVIGGKEFPSMSAKVVHPDGIGCVKVFRRTRRVMYQNVLATDVPINPKDYGLTVRREY